MSSASSSTMSGASSWCGPSLWAHLEVYSRDLCPKMLAVGKGSPYKKYSPADIALLEDLGKR